VTDPKIMVHALRILARDIESEDGVANICIAEAADMLEAYADVPGRADFGREINKPRGNQMTVSEFIRLMEEFRDIHGDLDVECYSANGGRDRHQGPVLAHRKILQGRESKADFAWKDEHRGEPVCKV